MGLIWCAFTHRVACSKYVNFNVLFWVDNEIEMYLSCITDLSARVLMNWSTDSTLSMNLLDFFVQPIPILKTCKVCRFC